MHIKAHAGQFKRDIILPVQRITNLHPLRGGIRIGGTPSIRHRAITGRLQPVNRPSTAGTFTIII